MSTEHVEVAKLSYLIGEECEYELARFEYVQDSLDQLRVVRGLSICFKAHIGAARLGCDVYGEVVALWQYSIH